MRFLARLILLGVLTCIGQQGLRQLGLAQSVASQAAQPSPATTPKGPAEADANIDPAQPVITVRGLCRDGSQGARDAASCSKVITREDFERLLDSLSRANQHIPDNARQTLARTYAEALALDAAARKEGLEDTPQFRAAIEFVRLRTAAELYRLNLQEKVGTPRQEEIDAFYKQHLPDFERVKLARILVPRQDPSATDKDAFDRKARDAANTARDRAAHGDDPARIEQDVYSALGLKAPPPTDLGNYGRSNFTSQEGSDVFALKAGEVSPVETEPNGYVIYKVESKLTPSEDQVRAEIVREISQQKFKDEIKAAIDAAPAEFNEQYFGPGIKTIPGVASPPPRPGH